MSDEKTNAETAVLYRPTEPGTPAERAARYQAWLVKFKESCQRADAVFAARKAAGLGPPAWAVRKLAEIDTRRGKC